MKRDDGYLCEVLPLVVSIAEVLSANIQTSIIQPPSTNSPRGGGSTQEDGRCGEG